MDQTKQLIYYNQKSNEFAILLTEKNNSVQFLKPEYLSHSDVYAYRVKTLDKIKFYKSYELIGNVND